MTGLAFQRLLRANGKAAKIDSGGRRVFFPQLRLVPRQTIRADPVAEFRLGFGADISFDWLP
jgi:hypothetical protein